MNDPNSSERKPALFENRQLRREAGEEWHKKGLNEQLLGALVTREELLDEIVDKQRESVMIQERHYGVNTCLK